MQAAGACVSLCRRLISSRAQGRLCQRHIVFMTTCVVVNSFTMGVNPRQVRELILEARESSVCQSISQFFERMIGPDMYIVCEDS